MSIQQIGIPYENDRPSFIPRTHLCIVFELRLVRTLRFFSGNISPSLFYRSRRVWFFSLVSFAFFAIFITRFAISSVRHTPKYTYNSIFRCLWKTRFSIPRLGGMFVYPIYIVTPHFVASELHSVREKLTTTTFSPLFYAVVYRTYKRFLFFEKKSFTGRRQERRKLNGVKNERRTPSPGHYCVPRRFVKKNFFVILSNLLSPKTSRRHCSL